MIDKKNDDPLSKLRALNLRLSAAAMKLELQATIRRSRGKTITAMLQELCNEASN